MVLSLDARFEQIDASFERIDQLPDEMIEHIAEALERRSPTRAETLTGGVGDCEATLLSSP
jgi:hypothetical protein